MRSVSCSENILLEEGLETGGRIIGQLQRVARAHEKVPRRLASDTGEIRPVPQQSRIVENQVFVEGDLQLVNVAEVRKELPAGRKKFGRHVLRQRLGNSLFAHNTLIPLRNHPYHGDADRRFAVFQ